MSSLDQFVSSLPDASQKPVTMSPPPHSIDISGALYSEGVRQEMPLDSQQVPSNGALEEYVNALPDAKAVGAAVTQGQKDQGNLQKYLQWRVQNEDREPQEQAEILRLSTALNTDPEAVAKDLPGARKQAEASGIDFEQLVSAHPALADFLGDPRTTALARGDTARLSGLAYLVGEGATPGAVSLWFRQRELARENQDLESRLLSGNVTDEAYQQQVSASAGLAVEALAKNPSRPMTADEVSRLKEQIAKNDGELHRLASYGDGVEEMKGVKWALAKTGKMLIEMGPEMAKGALAVAGGSMLGGVGGPAAGTAFWASETAPGLMWQAMQLRGPDGKQMLSDDQARAWAVGGSLPIGALLSFGLEGVGASFTKFATAQPLVEKALQKLTQQSVEKILSEKGVAGLVVRAGVNYGTHWLQGGLVMAGQSALTQATLEQAAIASRGIDAPGSVTDSMAQGFKQGLRDFAIMSAWGPFRGFLKERGVLQASIEGAERLKDVAEQTKESKLFEHSPEEGQKLLNRFGPDTRVYLKREALDSLAQEKKVSPRALAAGIFGDDGQAYDAAVQSNSDLAIPVGNWGAKVVRAGLEEKLRPDAKLSPNEFTPRETGERIKSISDTMLERAKTRGPAFESEVRNLRDTVYGVVRGAGYSHEQADGFSDIISRHAATTALQFDVSVRDAILRASLPQLHVEGRSIITGKIADALSATPEERNAIEATEPQGEAAQAAPASSAPSDEELRGELSKLREAGNAKAADVISRGLYGDDLTPGGNKKAYREFLKQNREGHYVAADLNDFKAVNDTFGHEAGDKAISSAGGVFSEASRAAKGKMFRPGGDEFVFHFEKPEQAQQFLDASREGFGKLPPVSGNHRLSFSAGASKGSGQEGVKAADFEAMKAKALKREKYGERNPETAGHGENFVSVGSETRPSETSSLPQEPKATVSVPKRALEERRGTIRFSVDKTGRAHDFDIRALKGDKSTLAHETGHWLSWSLHDLAVRSDAPEALKSDYEKLLKFAGYASPEERLSENLQRSKLANAKDLTPEKDLKLKELTAKEERISHAWETYLAEGKAPDRSLRTTFARFRRWMSEVYGGVQGIARQYQKTYGDELRMSDEVRGIFDRMLAVDRTVDDVKLEDQRLDVAGVLRLTPEETEREASLRAAKYEEARTGLDRVTASYNNAAATGYLAAEKERMRADADAETSAESPYTAVDFFKTGEFRNENGHVFSPEDLPSALKDKSGKPAKLSYDMALKDAGKKVAEKLLRDGMATKKDGISAGEVAEMFNFKDAKEMLESLAGAPEKEGVVEQKVARRFEDAFGPKLDQMGDALSAVGNEAMHNPADIQHALFVRDAIARALGGGKDMKLPREVLDLNAQRIIRDTQVQALSPKHYLDAERRNAREAVELLKKATGAQEGKADQFYAEALQKWDAVVLAKMLWRHASEAIHDIEAARDTLRRAAKPAWAQKLGLGDTTLAYAYANDSILRAIGIKDDGGKPDPAAFERALLQLQKDGAEGVVDGEDGKLSSMLWRADDIRHFTANPTPFERLTYDEALNVRDVVKNLRAVADGQNVLRVGEKRMTRKDLIEALRESAARLEKVNAPADPKALGILQRMIQPGRELFTHFDANLTDMEALVDRLVGNDRDAPLWRLFIGERYRARDYERALSNEFGKVITEKWEKLPAELRKRANEVIDGLGEALPYPDREGIVNPTSPRSRSWMWMVALNLGNAGNKQRMLDGLGWNEAEVMGLLQKNMTKAEWQWVQGVWDSLGSLYPHIEKVHVEDTGLRPERVEATPFSVQTSEGPVDLKGGYFPARYDPRFPSNRFVGEKQEAASASEMLGPYYRTAPAVAKGHAQARADANSDVLNLNFDVVPAHVSQVLHDVSHRLFVKNIAGVILDKDFQTIVRGRMGQAYAKQFGAWAQGVASQWALNAQDPMAKVNGLYSWAKSKATLAAVGFNISIPMYDSINPLMPVLGGELKATSLAASARDTLTSWSKTRAFALANSEQLRLRYDENANSLGVDIHGLAKSKGLIGDVEHAAYWMLERSDAMTTTTAWTAKYRERLSEGADAADASRDADAMVRKYWVSADPTMRPAWLRDKGLWGGITFLYGFGSKLYNINRRTILHAYDSVKEPGTDGWTKAKAIGSAMAVMTMQAALLEGVGAFLSGHGPKETDDPEKYIKEHAASYVGQLFPLAGLFTGNHGSLPPEGLYKTLKDEITGFAENKKGPTEFAAYLGALAVLRGTGIAPITRAARYYDRNGTDDLRSGAAGRFVSGLLYGGRGAVTPFNAPDVLTGR